MWVLSTYGTTVNTWLFIWFHFLNVCLFHQEQKKYMRLIKKQQVQKCWQCHTNWIFSGGREINRGKNNWQTHPDHQFHHHVSLVKENPYLNKNLKKNYLHILLFLRWLLMIILKRVTWVVGIVLWTATLSLNNILIPLMVIGVVNILFFKPNFHSM